jgi:hypothetical protein
MIHTALVTNTLIENVIIAIEEIHVAQKKEMIVKKWLK